MRILYLDCFSGISGDMTVGALVDAGVPPEKIEAELKKLPLSGYQLRWDRVVKKGIYATKFEVMMQESAWIIMTMRAITPIGIILILSI